jgi:hypothetical protein
MDEKLDTGAGKGHDSRPGVHGKDWDACPLWENQKRKKALEKKKKTKKK